jgi:hypothetical protein
MLAGLDVKQSPGSTMVGRVESISHATVWHRSYVGRLGQVAYRGRNRHLINNFDHTSHAATTLETQPLGIARRKFSAHGNHSALHVQANTASTRNTSLVQEVRKPMLYIAVHARRVERRDWDERHSHGHGDLLPGVAARAIYALEAADRP